MSPATVLTKRESDANPQLKTASVAWVAASLFYFYQYALRSAPSVMMPQLSDAFGLSAAAVASIVGLFYYGYSPFSLVAGAGMDRFGPERILPLAAIVTGLGALLFAIGNTPAGSIGRLLQGAGGGFASVGAIYIASTRFPPSWAATLVGATQMFGMAGGAAGQFVVGPLIARNLAWNHFWIAIGVIGLGIGFLLFFLLPKNNVAEQRQNGSKNAVGAFLSVIRNPQSILCGLIAGLLFIPTTIFDMVWGVRYLQDAHGLDYASAVMHTATVPLGWIIGSPLWGFLSDRIGRRKPVIAGGAALLFACLGWILFGKIGVFPPYMIGLVAGIASGVAMVPYSVIKEINLPQYGGMATGVLGFLNFMFSALVGPIFGWILHRVAGGSSLLEQRHYQVAFAPLLLGVGAAIALTLLLVETGTATRQPLSTQEARP